MEEIKTRFERIVEIGKVSRARIDKLNEYLEHLDNDCEFKEDITDIVNSLADGDIKKSMSKKIQNCLDKMNENTELDDVGESTFEVVSNTVKLEEIEKTIDSQIKKYSGFSDKKPMDYVGYDKSQKKYVGRYNKKTRTSTECSVACHKTLELIKGNISETIKEIVFCHKAMLKYKNKQLILFSENKIDILFDIQHVIGSLNLNVTSSITKYTEFSPKITNYMCVKNEFGGYIIRELIPEEVMYEIVLSSNSEFSKSFKKDVSQIIKNARKDGKLFVNSSGDIEYDAQDKTSKKFLQIAGCDIDTTKKALEMSVSAISCVYLFTIGQVCDLKEKMNIPDSYDDDSIVIKFGMTDNLLRRSKEHHKTFKEFDGDAKLKYYAWVDESYQSEAETDIKKYFSTMKTLFTCGDMKELAIITHDELKETKKKYEKIADLYGGKITMINLAHNNEISEIKHKLSIEKKNHKCAVIELEKQIEIIKKECAEKLLQMSQQVVESEKEKNKILSEKHHHHKRHNKKEE